MSCVWAYFPGRFPHHAWTAQFALSDFVGSRVYAYLGENCHLHFWQNDLGLFHATAVTSTETRQITLKTKQNKKNLLPLLPVLKLIAFQPRTWRSTNWAMNPTVCGELPSSLVFCNNRLRTEKTQQREDTMTIRQWCCNDEEELVRSKQQKIKKKIKVDTLRSLRASETRNCFKKKIKIIPVNTAVLVGAGCNGKAQCYYFNKIMSSTS